MQHGETPERIEVVAEQLEISKREVELGRVVVRLHVEERQEIAETELLQEDRLVERVTLDLPVDEAPATREEDGVLIIPVLEERLVVRKQLFLKEELRITRNSRTQVVRTPVRLRSEHAEIVRQQTPASDTSHPERNT